MSETENCERIVLTYVLMMYQTSSIDVDSNVTDTDVRYREFTRLRVARWRARCRDDEINRRRKTPAVHGPNPSVADHTFVGTARRLFVECSVAHHTTVSVQ